jgi:AcrR family transcriptional regulator
MTQTDLSSNTPDTQIPSQAGVQLSREQILQATARCLRDFGYDATTIRKIAGQLGCAVGSIYRYFRDKRELLLAVASQTLEPVVAMAEAGEPFESTVRMYHQVVTHAEETYRLMFWLSAFESSDGSTKMPLVIQRVVNAWSTQLGSEQTAREAWSILHGYIQMGRSGEETLAALRRFGRGEQRPQPTPAERAAAGRA